MTAQSHTSRRLFLAAGSAGAVFGVLAQAAAASTPADDPIFAAIERHRAAWSALQDANDSFDKVLLGRSVTQDERALCAAADEEEFEALDALLATAPTSKAGIRAALEYLKTFDATGAPDNIAAFCETLVTSPVLSV